MSCAILFGYCNLGDNTYLHNHHPAFDNDNAFDLCILIMRLLIMMDQINIKILPFLSLAPPWISRPSLSWYLSTLLPVQYSITSTVIIFFVILFVLNVTSTFMFFVSWLKERKPHPHFTISNIIVFILDIFLTVRKPLSSLSKTRNASRIWASFPDEVST